MSKAGQAAEVQIAREITLGSLVRDALRHVDGDAEKATSRVLAQLRADKKLLEQVIRAAVVLGVSERVHSTILSKRESIAKQADRVLSKVVKLSPRERSLVLAEGLMSCLLDMPIIGGRVREAGHASLREQIDIWEKSANTQLHRARWLRLVLQCVPDGKVVGDVLTEERALELFEAARKEEKQV